MKKNIFMIFILPLFLAGCSDSDIATKMEGSWENTIASFEKGDDAHVVQTTTFTKNTDDDGGTFTAVLNATAHDDDVNCTLSYNSSIKGTWGVTLGDLDLHYDLSTLSVHLTSFDIDVSDDFDDEDDVVDYYSYKRECEQEFKKSANEEIHDFYESFNDEDGSFTDIKVNENTMSFNTTDDGRMKFTRVK